MGREIRRVPLGFDWPLGKRWEGFINPYYRECPEPHCHRGRTAARAIAEAAIDLILVAGSSAQRGGTTPPEIRKINWESFDWISQDALELSTALAGRKPSAFGHDACDRWSAVEKVIAAAGLPKEWGYCPVCKGDYIDPAYKERYEAWQPTDPPAGDGWQTWETVSEGSPISPVFATAEALVEWLVSQGYSRTAAEAFTKQGWAPSMVSVDGKLYNDIESAAHTGGPDS